jgi:hypothetical protein
MHPEIEKLIDLALADGQITEKERNVILKKAAEFGVDADEVEMTLDGKLHQLEANKPKQKEKVGNIKTCPACGASVKALKLKCDDCEHEFTNTKSNSNLTELEKKLVSAKGDKKRIQIITDHPIPNSKEDLIEMATFFSGKVLSSRGQSNSTIQNDTEVTKAYYGRALEVINKIRIMAHADLEINKTMDLIEIKMQNTIKKQKSSFVLDFWARMIFTIALCYFLYAFIAKLFGYHFWPF